MPFPLVIASNTTNGTGAGTSVTVNLPAATGGRMLMVSLHRCAVAGAIGWPIGWVELVDASSDASDDQMAIAYKWTTGAEGATMTVTQGNGKFANLTWLIANAQDPTIQAPELSTVATGTSTSPNPTTVTPTGGTKDYLFLWLGGWEGEQTSPPASQPANYSGPIGANSGVAGVVATNCRVASAWRANQASSEDPGAWTISVSDDWTAYAMAIHPAFARRPTADHNNPAFL